MPHVLRMFKRAAPEHSVTVASAYDNRRRAGTREAIVEVARDLFLRGGYAATTIAAIAEAADVSMETISKGFGEKPGLVRAIVAKGLEGDGPVPAERRSDEMQATERDPYRVLPNWVAFVTEISPRVGPLEGGARAASKSHSW